MTLVFIENGKMTNYYHILGICSNAPQAEIKLAFRKLALKFHPDKNPGDLYFEGMFRQIQEAYAILGDPEKRKKYDQDFSSETETSNRKKIEKFWSLQGRLGREAFLGRALLLYFAFYISKIIGMTIFGPPAIILSLVLILFCIGMFLIQSAKRLHDLNMNGWLSLIFLIPYVNYLMAF